MKRSQPDSWDQTEIDMFADEGALQSGVLGSPSDWDEDATMATETDEEHLRRWKAEQANKVRNICKIFTFQSRNPLWRLCTLPLPPPMTNLGLDEVGNP
jgi:hypothetical protein